MDETGGMEDAALARLATEDEGAFEQLVSRYKDRVFRLCLSIVGDSGLAEDMAQEAFVRVHLNLARYDARHKFSAWLFRIAANVSATCLQRRRRERAVIALRPVVPLAAPDTQDRAALAVPALTQALAAIPERHRQVLTMRVCEGLTCREIGEILDMTPNAVSVAIYKAKQAIAEKMGAGHGMRRDPVAL